MDHGTPEELAEAAKHGDEEALEALVRTAYPRVLNLAFRLCGNAYDAEDIAQESCVRLAKAIRGFRGDALFYTWLYRIVTSTCRDSWRKQQRRGKSVELPPEFAAEAATPPRPEVWEAVQKLAVTQREAVVLVYWEGLTHAEAAASLGCAEVTISWRVHAARRKLRKILEVSS